MKAGQSHGEGMAKKDSSLGNFSGYAPLRTELSTQENVNKQFNDFNNGTDYTNKSNNSMP